MTTTNMIEMSCENSVPTDMDGSGDIHDRLFRRHERSQQPTERVVLGYPIEKPTGYLFSSLRRQESCISKVTSAEEQWLAVF
jgi:hypothetical protein